MTHLVVMIEINTLGAFFACGLRLGFYKTKQWKR